jgi:hypothetical protein
MHACEEAVRIEPQNGSFRDSRGVARALTGNKEGAIEDFKAFIAWADESHEPGHSQERRSERTAWIDKLSAGEDPFTREEIEKLWNQ